MNEPLPYINTTSHDHYRAYYNEDSIEKVREVFAKDIEIGEYTF